mmetsp:Transcript_38766/g.71658  ORF Transcript_38766/g.71658 Transcript_38766/m.71658 type:complete len:90 (+) Transcript_38766:417-686(+)
MPSSPVFIVPVVDLGAISAAIGMESQFGNFPDSFESYTFPLLHRKRVVGGFKLDGRVDANWLRMNERLQIHRVRIKTKTIAEPSEIGAL